MKIVKTVKELKEAVSRAKAAGRTVGFVPTMGALHAGHKSLVDRARKENDFVVVSVFVNPTQFNNPADLATYPRTENEDAALLEKAGADLAFMPDEHEVYGDVPDTRKFNLGPVAEVMEGAMRPGHFNGVAQIVSKLFDWVKPDKAYFGEKDFQQIAVIRRMCEIEGFNDIEIVACPIVREHDGLALSSRNVRLSPEQRLQAPAIHKVLARSLTDREAGMTVAEVVSSVVRQLDELPGVKVEYFTIVDGKTMQPIENWEDSSEPVGCITVYFGDVRLIDNIRY